ncbi:MAG: YfhO family protein [bacterium]|nr:YfhO family protein [bacterium]
MKKFKDVFSNSGMNQIKSKLIKIIKTQEFIVVLMLTLAMGFLFRDVFLKNKIVFPSNFLASYYSPWATQKFSEFPHGIPNKPIGGNDQVRMFYPYRTFTTESLKRGELPLWNPYNFSGSPIVANFQSAVFYPLNILYLILPQITAWSILVVLQPLMGTLFMYLFLRLCNLRKAAAFFGAFSFGFSGFILAWSQENAVVGQAALWLPAVLYATEKLVLNSTLKHFVILVCTLACCFFAGHYQFAFYVFLTSASYGLTRILQEKKSGKITKSFVLASAYAVMLLVCAIQLFPSIEAFMQGPRSSVSMYPVIKVYLMPATHFISALAPDILGNPGTYNYFGRGFYQESVFYAGIIPVVFAILAIYKWRKNKLIGFFIALLFISYLFGIDSPFTHWFNQLPIPIITTFSPSRIFFLTAVAISVLGAFGFNYWLEEENKKDRIVLYSASIVSAIAIATVIGIFYTSVHTPNPVLSRMVEFIIQKGSRVDLGNIQVAMRNSVLPVVMLGITFLAVLMRRKLPIAPVIIVIVFCLGQFYFFNKYLVLGEKSLLYPDNLVFTDIQKNQNNADRFLSFGLPILGDVNLQKHTFSPDGIDPVFSSRYGQLLYATKIDGRFTKNTPQIEANLSEYGDNLNIIDNPRRLRLMSLLGVTRIYNYEPGYRNLDQIDKIFPQKMITPLWNKEGWQAYQNNDALPRAFLADNYVIETDPQKSLNTLFNERINLAETLVLEEEPLNFLVKTDKSIESTGTAQIKSYAPQKVEIETNTTSEKLLFLSDNYYSGWQAYVDNTPTKIYRADFAFRAVVVPQGTHNVTFIFQPLSVYAGMIISLVSVIILTLLWHKR